jgi:hypothetical protein
MPVQGVAKLRLEPEFDVLVSDGEFFEEVEILIKHGEVAAGTSPRGIAEYEVARICPTARLEVGIHCGIETSLTKPTSPPSSASGQAKYTWLV